MVTKIEINTRSDSSKPYRTPPDTTLLVDNDINVSSPNLARVGITGISDIDGVTIVGLNPALSPIVGRLAINTNGNRKSIEEQTVILNKGKKLIIDDDFSHLQVTVTNQPNS